MKAPNLMKISSHILSFASVLFLSSCFFSQKTSSQNSSLPVDSSRSSADASSSNVNGSSSSQETSHYSSSSLPEPGSFNGDQLILDNSVTLKWQDNGFEGDGYAFRFQNATHSEDTFLTLSHGGYLTNSVPFAKDILSVTVAFQENGDYGSLLTKCSTYPITSPANGAYALESNETFLCRTHGSYISIYAPLTAYSISSITLTFGDSRSDYESVNKIEIYTINDTHGAASYASGDGKYQSGIRKLSSCLREEERYCPDSSIVLSSGDMWQGGAESNLTKGRYMVDWMNLIGFESMAIGNHEFDWKVDTIAANATQANFPFLGINIVDTAGNRPSWAKPSKVIERGPYRIGVIGAIGPVESSIASASRGGYSFLWSNITSLVETESNRLRKEEGCNLVLLSFHYSSSKTAYSTTLWPGIDAVLEGHTHQSYGFVDKNGVPHVQTYANGSDIRKISFAYSESEKKLVYQNYEDIPFDTIAKKTDDPLTDRMALHYEAEVASISKEVVYHSETSIGKNDLAQFAVRAFYEYYRDDSSDTRPFVAAIINTGAVRQTLPAGDITYGDLMAALPFDNTNIVASTSPSTLTTWLNNSYYSTYSVTYDASLSEVRFVTLSYAMDKLSSSASMISEDATPVLRDIVATAFKEGKYGTYGA